MRVTAGGWTLWGAGAIACAIAQASDLSLVNDSGSAVVVLPDQADTVTREAAALLQKYVEKSAASSLRVLPERDSTGGGPRICVGRSRAVNLLVGARLDRLSVDGFIMKTEGERLILAGRTPVGDRNAAREFLRRYCGVEWYMPGGLWEVVKRQQNLTIPDVDAVVEPAFSSRARAGLTGGASAGLNAQWALAHGTASRHDYDVDAGRVLRSERYAGRAEFFALTGGRRRTPAAGSERGWQLCMTNPAVIDEYARLAEAWLARRGELLSVSATPNSGGGFCECAGCRALWDEGAAADRRATRLTLHFVNEVARRLAKFRPDRMVALRAEDLWAEPVEGAAVEANVIVFVSGCDGAGGAADVAALRERIKRWKAVGARHLGLRERLRGCDLATPELHAAGIAAEIRLAREEGIEAWASEDYPSWGLQGPQAWVVARLLWEPELDAEQLTGRFCADLFGPASGSMLAYFRRCEERSARGSTAGYAQEVRRELRGLLAQAEKESFGVEPEYTRVRYFSAAFGWTERMAAWAEGGTAALRAARAGDFPGALAALGELGGEEDDPLLYMKMALDPLAGAHYCKSGGLGTGLLDVIGSAVRARAELAQTALQAAVAKAVASAPPAGADVEKALDAAIAERCPGALSAPARRALSDVRKMAGRYAAVPRAPADVVIDGDAGEPGWRGAQDESGFTSAGGLLAAQCRTSFRLVWREGRLHAAFNCFQPMDAPKGTSVARDGQARSDDAVEIAIAPVDAPPGSRPLRVVVTVKGVVQVENAVEASSEVRAAARERADRWCAEVAIPLRAAGIDPAQARAARLNVARYVRGRGAVPEESAWFPVFADEGGVLPKGWVLFNNGTARAEN